MGTLTTTTRPRRTLTHGDTAALDGTLTITRGTGTYTGTTARLIVCRGGSGGTEVLDKTLTVTPSGTGYAIESPTIGGADWTSMDTSGAYVASLRVTEGAGAGSGVYTWFEWPITVEPAPAL